VNTWKVFCPECGWHDKGSLEEMQRNLTLHHQESKHKAALRIAPTLLAETRKTRILEKCCYPMLSRRCG